MARPPIVLQHLEPLGDIGGVILAHLRRQAKIGAQERACQFGDQLLGGIPFIAPPLARE
jgi:hypothetical protein